MSKLLELEDAMRAGSSLDATAIAKQRVVVIGGGVQGTSTAYWLGRAGHSVTVLEATPAPLRSSSSSPSYSAAEIGNAASYTGVLQLSSTMAPFFARPQIMQAMKVQWCPYPYTFLSPTYRVGLFDSKNPVSKAVRRSLYPFMNREQFMDSSIKLYGLALFNQFLAKQLVKEWGSSRSPSPISRAQGTTSIMFDQGVYVEHRYELQTQYHLHDEKALNASAQSATGPIRSTSSDNVPSRFRSMLDTELLEVMPNLLPQQYNIAGGGVSYPDEFALDPVEVLNKMKQDAVNKYGVKYQYSTPVSRMVQGSNGVSNAVTPGGDVVTADAFVLCAGADSKRIVRDSMFKDVPLPIQTFTTKTTYLSFPQNQKSAPASFIPPQTVLLPGTMTAFTAYPTHVRMNIGNDLNPLEEWMEAPATEATIAAPTKLRIEPPVEASKLKLLIDDVNLVYPAVTRDVISQNGKTIPKVALRTWTSDNKPLLGLYHNSINNLFINSAHGNLGWNHAIAAGKHVADLISCTPTFITNAQFAPNRFQAKK